MQLDRLRVKIFKSSFTGDLADTINGWASTMSPNAELINVYMSSDDRGATVMITYEVVK